MYKHHHHTKSISKRHEVKWTIKNLFLAACAFFTGSRIQTLPSGQVRILFKWQYLTLCFFAVSFGLFFLFNSYQFSSWHNIDLNDDEYLFAPFLFKKHFWRHYITNQPAHQPAHHPKLYYPRNCPHDAIVCAKPVPSFIFAGTEFAGASFVFELLRQHPQVASAIETRHTVFDKEGEFDEANAFESYIKQFPFLKEDVLATLEEKKTNWIVGEHAPRYLYHSHLTAKRIKDTLPHVKLVFFLREPIERAYSQYMYEKSQEEHVDSNHLSFETLINLELPILRRCGHTSTQTGWEGFVRCHQGSEIRASWKVSNDSIHAFNSLAKGMYYPALKPFLQQFPASQLFVLKTEDILLHPSQSFRQLAKFLDIDSSYFDDSYEITEQELLNQDYQQLQLSTRYKLQRVFRHLNTRLQELFHHSVYFNGWIYDVDRG